VGSPSAADAAPFDFRRCDQRHIADRPGFFVGEALHRLAGVLGIGFGVVAAAAMIAGWVFLKRHETRLADGRSARSRGRSRRRAGHRLLRLMPPWRAPDDFPDGRTTPMTPLLTTAALAHAGPSVLAAFLASLVEFVEALTVVLAVGTVRGWRPALTGTGLGLAVLAALVLALGPALTRIPLGLVRLAVGTLILLFGLRWLRKAVLRAAGVIPLHDEAAAFAGEAEALRRQGSAAGGWDRVGVATAFKIVMLEGIEVVFIVVAIGAAGRGLLLPASLGAFAAFLLVVLLGLLLHRPLARVPENALKLAVGVLLCGFGTFWAGEGLGVAWPGADWSALALVAGFLLTALATVALCRGAMVAPGRGRVGAG
jgi:Ca2+/H+ antiporter, TMEM165/GDT1 family